MSRRYSLAGVRKTTTAPQEAFIAKATEVLSANDRVLAAYLVGGFAVGMGDAFSDVDLQLIVAKDAAGDLADSWVELIHRIVPGRTGLGDDARAQRREPVPLYQASAAVSHGRAERPAGVAAGADPTIDSAIDGYVALIEIFLPRARRLAEATGVVFPEAYARAGVAYFERSVGARIAV